MLLEKTAKTRCPKTRPEMADMQSPPLAEEQAFIMVIDDDPSILGIYSTALRMAGHRVATADSAESALNLVEREIPDLILSDINMPGLNGMAFLQEVRKHPNLQDTQIILMTGNNPMGNSRRAMNQGADDFLSKPIKLEELYACVSARLKRAEINRRLRRELMADLRQKLGSTLPHEFLTPLAGILGLAEIMREEIETMPRDEIKGFVLDIERSGLRLHRTLRNYLWILEADRWPDLKPAVTPPNRAAYLVDLAVQTVLRRHERPLHLERYFGEAGVLYVEETAFEIIAEELISNALQFSEKGRPISLSLSGRQLRVKDEGRGLTPDQVEAIGAFQQFDRKEMEQQGLGLGLALVKQLCEAMGATLEIASQYGKGTEVVVTFPLPPEDSGSS